MGKLGHPTPQRLTSLTPNILVGGGPLYPSEEPHAREASPVSRALQGDNLDQTCSETSKPVLGQTPTVPSSLPVCPGGGSSLSPQDSIVLDVEYSPSLVQQGLGLASRLLTPAVPKRPTGASLPGSSIKAYLPSQKNLRPGQRPQVKACVLCTGGSDLKLPVLKDTCLILEGLARVPNINPDHIITRTSQLIDVALDQFFDPINIDEGALLILILSCHGMKGYGNNVLLQFKAQDGTIVDSRMLQDKIMALPKHCTLEVIVDTCCAEYVIPGLYRVSILDPSTRCSVPATALGFIPTHTQPSGSRLNSQNSAPPASTSTGPSVSFPAEELPNYPSSFFEQDQPKYKAQVIVWAASTGWSNSFTEENLPETPGVYSILIGAIFRSLSSNGSRSGISRRSLWQNISTVVERHNNARCERDLRKPPAVQVNLKNRTQRAILLTSVDNPSHVLTEPVFTPLKL